MNRESAKNATNRSQRGEVLNHSLYGRQLSFIMINTLIGSGVYLLPSLLAKEAGHDGWLLALVLTALPILYTFLICTFFKRSKMSFADTMKDMMGASGGIVRGLYIIMLTLFCIVALKTVSELISTNMLPTTPVAVIQGVIMLCVIYVISKGMQVIGRINVLLFLCFLLLGLAFLLSIDRADVRNLLPIANVSNWGNPIKGIFTVLSFFIGLEVLYAFYPVIENKTAGRKHALWGVLISGAGFAVINFVCVLVFGEYMLSELGYSTMLLLRSSTNGLFVRLFFTLLLFNLMLIKPLINCGFAATATLLELIPHLQKKGLITLLAWGSIVVAVAAILPPVDELEKIYLFLLAGGVLYGLILPVMGIIKYRPQKTGIIASARSINSAQSAQTEGGQ